jgi:hypothetical protein
LEDGEKMAKGKVPGKEFLEPKGKGKSKRIEVTTGLNYHQARLQWKLFKLLLKQLSHYSMSNLKVLSSEN